VCFPKDVLAGLVEPAEYEVVVALVQVGHVAPASLHDRVDRQDHRVCGSVLHLLWEGCSEPFTDDQRLGLDGLVAGDDRAIFRDRQEDGAVSEWRRDAWQQSDGHRVVVVAHQTAAGALSDVGDLVDDLGYHHHGCCGGTGFVIVDDVDRNSGDDGEDGYACPCNCKLLQDVHCLIIAFIGVFVNQHPFR